MSHNPLASLRWYGGCGGTPPPHLNLYQAASPSPDKMPQRVPLTVGAPGGASRQRLPRLPSLFHPELVSCVKGSSLEQHFKCKFQKCAPRCSQPPHLLSPCQTHPTSQPPNHSPFLAPYVGRREANNKVRRCRSLPCSSELPSSLALPKSSTTHSFLPAPPVGCASSSTLCRRTSPSRT